MNWKTEILSTGLIGMSLRFNWMAAHIPDHVEVNLWIATIAGSCAIILYTYKFYKWVRSQFKNDK